MLLSRLVDSRGRSVASDPIEQAINHAMAEAGRELEALLLREFPVGTVLDSRGRPTTETAPCNGLRAWLPAGPREAVDVAP